LFFLSRKRSLSMNIWWILGIVGAIAAYFFFFADTTAV
jgi:hypothetical protein